MTALRIRHVNKSFSRSAPVLNDINLSIAPGELVGLIGASGSGKSTLIRLISGFETIDRDEGEIEILGQKVQSGGKRLIAARNVRRDVGVIFQQFNLVNRLSLLTNVLLGRLGRVSRLRGTIGLFSIEDRIRALRALERVGIVDLARQRASTLSGGQQQRAAIARALTQEARLVLADEPIASLDPKSADVVMGLLCEINRRDKVTIVVSLHQIDYAFQYCSRILALKDGRIVHDGSPHDIGEEALRAIYGIEDTNARRALRPAKQDMAIAMPPETDAAGMRFPTKRRPETAL
ncbi:phosphonate ABC transporter ATP-binding protein [Roseibium aggregatum]|uniref:Phosphonate ABC transporter ATP-binding protein n=1 Tax=Roseibium aggregatum TaxID=187304 RepID=A0A939E8X6_9HYPH|nr:phosphonate ABC transporter ATP-binding protein [Roseibium aggregatum]MBN9669046.1 phosphonate ABC transporter ATP-binding protein [Roseibium aggregatum]